MPSKAAAQHLGLHSTTAHIRFPTHIPEHTTCSPHGNMTHLARCLHKVTLVEAQLESLAEVLQRCPNVQHIGLASGHDIPLRLIR